MLRSGGMSGITALIRRHRTCAGVGVLEIRLLGDMRVVLDGAERTVVPGRQRLLLARLTLAEGRFVQVDQLIDDLWEDRPPSSAANAVQVYVSSLRKLLGSTAVRTR